MHGSERLLQNAWFRMHGSERLLQNACESLNLF
jgi:hypothetical protein